MMNILLCTPYLDAPGVVAGGIAVWARNILGYYGTLKSDVNVTAVSYDRRYNVSGRSTVWSRFVYGIRDYSSSIVRTYKALKRGDVSIMHLCTSAQLSLYKDLLVLKMASHYGAKVIVHFHFGRIPELVEAGNAECRILMKVCKAADSIIVMDKRSADALMDIGFENVHNLPNPLSLEVMEQVKELEGTIRRIPGKLVFVGDAIRTKGIYELVDAGRQLDNVQIHIIGADSEADVSSLCRKASLKDDGKWLMIRGCLPHREVLREMMSASVFAFPSWTEGFPNVILEAMACGCPIVTTAVGAISEMLDADNGSNCGICVQPRLVQPFADALMKMLSEPEYAASCAERARKRVNEMYSVPVVWEKLRNIWSTVLWK